MSLTFSWDFYNINPQTSCYNVKWNKLASLWRCMSMMQIFLTCRRSNMSRWWQIIPGDFWGYYFLEQKQCKKNVSIVLLRQWSDYRSYNKRKIASVCVHPNYFFYIWGIDIFICPIANNLRSSYILKGKFLVS